MIHKSGVVNLCCPCIISIMSIEKLQKFGLTDKEARVYMALLEIGDSVVTDVAKHAKVNRSTAYVLIDALLKRGLISVSERRGVKIFSAVTPNKLNEIAQLKYSEATELVKISKDLSEDLKKIKKVIVSSSKTNLNVFEGSEGMKLVSQDLVNSKSQVRAFISDPLNKLNLLEKIGVKSKILLPDTGSARNILKSSKLSSKHEFFLSPEISDEYALAVCGNKVHFISLADGKSFIVENQYFAGALSEIYELALHRAKKWNIKEEEKSVSTQAKNKELVKAQGRFLGNI